MIWYMNGVPGMYQLALTIYHVYGALRTYVRTYLLYDTMVSCAAGSLVLLILIFNLCVIPGVHVSWLVLSTIVANPMMSHCADATCALLSFPRRR